MSRSKNSLEFSGGIMTYKNGTVTANPDKGSIILAPSKESGIIQVDWKPRDESKKAQVFKFSRGNTEVVNVAQCADGKVFLLKAKDSTAESDHHFFWFQDRITATTHEERLESIRKMFVPQVKLDEFNKMLVNISSRLQAPEIKLTDILSSPKLGEVLKANSDYFVSKLSQHAARKDLNPSNLVEEVKNPFVYAAAARLQEILNDPVSYQYLCRSFGIQGRPSDGNIRKGVNDLLEDLKKSGK